MLKNLSCLKNFVPQSSIPKDQFYSLIQAAQVEIELKARITLLKTCKSCFLGSELTAWLSTNCGISKNQALAWIQHLQDEGYVDQHGNDGCLIDKSIFLVWSCAVPISTGTQYRGVKLPPQQHSFNESLIKGPIKSLNFNNRSSLLDKMNNLVSVSLCYEGIIVSEYQEGELIATSLQDPNFKVQICTNRSASRSFAVNYPYLYALVDPDKICLYNFETGSFTHKEVEKWRFDSFLVSNKGYACVNRSFVFCHHSPELNDDKLVQFQVDRVGFEPSKCAIMWPYLLLASKHCCQLWDVQVGICVFFQEYVVPLVFTALLPEGVVVFTGKNFTTHVPEKSIGPNGIPTYVLEENSVLTGGEAFFSEEECDSGENSGATMGCARLRRKTVENVTSQEEIDISRLTSHRRMGPHAVSKRTIGFKSPGFGDPVIDSHEDGSGNKKGSGKSSAEEVIVMRNLARDSDDSSDNKEVEDFSLPTPNQSQHPSITPTTEITPKINCTTVVISNTTDVITVASTTSDTDLGTLIDTSNMCSSDGNNIIANSEDGGNLDINSEIKFEEPDNENNIIFADGSVKAATFSKLVEKLTAAHVDLGMS
eukprot:TRINITY_DN9873_c0_g1_i4.p2 TRINITY_DN9873_c0_g1~~TRINITY_DN9873_c0_g1_i4.p2  ORF type:complete len:594 (-),score=111.06 TRINITY_DN9873_c0_g1_i4:2254-4035(-)